MIVTPDQIRAARAMLRLGQEEVARRAHVAIVTIRRIEAVHGANEVASDTVESVCKVLEEAGAEFIPHGVRRRQRTKAEAEEMFKRLEAISIRSAARLRDGDRLTKADLYDENGRPA